MRSDKILPRDFFPICRRGPKCKLEDEETKDINGPVSKSRTLVLLLIIAPYLNLTSEPTFSSLNPKAEPNTIANRQSQPIASLAR